MKALDVVLRFAYCTMVPIVIGGFATVVPVGGIVVSAVLAIAIALAGTDRWRATMARVPLVGRGLGNMARLGDYYVEHPVRPVLYYIFYPLLFPYWLVSRRARGEFLLYRRINVLALAVLIVAGITDYLSNWRPELGVGAFLSAAIATFVLQSVLTMSAVMPLVTTVITFHHERRRGLLIALACSAGFIAFASVAFVATDPHLPQSTEFRLRGRGRVAPARAEAALDHAARAAHAALPPGAPPGHAAAAVEDAARAALEDLWKPDETRGFEVWTGEPGHVVVVLARFRHEPAIWIATDARGARLPLDALPPWARALVTSRR